MIQAILYWHLYKMIVGFSFICDNILNKVDN